MSTIVTISISQFKLTWFFIHFALLKGWNRTLRFHVGKTQAKTNPIKFKAFHPLLHCLLSSLHPFAKLALPIGGGPCDASIIHFFALQNL